MDDALLHCGEASPGDSVAPSPPRLSRRKMVRLVGVGVGVTVVRGTLGAGEGPSVVHGQASPTLVRLAAVNTPEFSGLLDALLDTFTTFTGYQVEVYSGEDVYEQARAGRADIVLSHYGHRGVEPFLGDGLGQWPRTVFANQIALLGPAADPARVRGLSDVVEAFGRIADSGAPYVVNSLPGLLYLDAIIREAAMRPTNGSWYLNHGLQQEAAVEEAAAIGGYALWGAFPFLRLQRQRGFDLQPLVLGDPLLQRVMGTTIVNPQKFPGANIAGARALEQYLLAPATQARIRAFRVPEIDQPLWWPAGRHNNPSVLPL